MTRIGKIHRRREDGSIHARLFERQFVEPEREGRRERVGCGRFPRVPVAVRGRIAKDARRELHRLDNPQLADARRRAYSAALRPMS